LGKGKSSKVDELSVSVALQPGKILRCENVFPFFGVRVRKFCGGKLGQEGKNFEG
jgi:hypothetical protein